MISRRFFLIGSAAAIAVASTSLPVAAVQPVPALIPFRLRQIKRLGGYNNSAHPMRIDLTVGGELMMSDTVGPFNSYLYVPCGWERCIELSCDDVLTLCVRGSEEFKDGHLAGIDLICRDRLEGAVSVDVIEQHVFPPKEPPRIMGLDIKDCDLLERYTAPTTRRL